MRHRGFVSIAIILVVLIAAILVVGVSYWENYNNVQSPHVAARNGGPPAHLSSTATSLSTTPPSTSFPSAMTLPQSHSASVPSSTPGWKLYTSSQYGFSFEYPSSSCIGSDTNDIGPSIGPAILFIENHCPFTSTGYDEVAMTGAAQLQFGQSLDDFIRNYGYDPADTITDLSYKGMIAAKVNTGGGGVDELGANSFDYYIANLQTGAVFAFGGFEPTIANILAHFHFSL